MTPSTNLICFPFGGGSGNMFESWKGWMPSNINIVPYDLPGHGRKIQSNLIDCMDELMSVIENDLVAYFSSTYAIFGHSLGALIGYRLVRQRCERKKRLPVAFITSACRAPHLRYSQHGLYLKDDKEFLSILKTFGGIPQALLNDEKALQFYLKILKADLKLAESTHNYPNKPIEDIHLYNFCAIDDPLVSIEDSDEWAKHFAKIFNYYFNGGHFFPNDCEVSFRDAMINVMNSASVSQITQSGCCNKCRIR